MALPSTRNTTYGAASPVLSNDLNAIQDCIIGRKHGDIVIPLRINPDFISTTSAKWYLDLPVGTVIKSFTFALYGNGADDLSALFEQNNKDNTVASTITGPTAYNDQAATFADKVFDVADSTVTDAAQFVLTLVGVGTWAVASFNGNLVLAGTNLKVKSIRMTISKP